MTTEIGGDGGPTCDAREPPCPDRRLPRKRFCVLHNPAAGRNGIRLARSVADELRGKGATVDVRDLSEGLPSRDVIADRYEAIVVSGGDGTVRSIAALLPPSVPLGIIPNGTANVMASELLLPRSAVRLADLFMRGPTHRIEGGTADGTPFLMMFGAGFDGEVVRDVSRATLQSVGKLAYVRPVLSALLKKPELFDVRTDGIVTRASWILVSNMALYAGRFRLTDQTSVREPGMVAVISRATTRRQRLAELLRLAFGKIGNAPTIETRRVEDASVLTPGIAAQIDGEPLAPAPYRIARRAAETVIIAP